MAEFASKGIAGAGLGTGIAGLSLGVLNSLGGLGGILLGNRAVPFAAGMAAEAGCSENHTVNRYELSMVQENAKLRSDIALRDANTYQDQKMLEMYKYIDGKLGEVHVTVPLGGKYGDSTLTALYNAGKIADTDGDAVSIVGTDGTVYVQGTSRYTVIVSQYSAACDLSGAGTASDWSEHEVAFE